MAYVVARPADRYEIRESVQTAKGPRARSLANFAVLTEAVLEAAAGRAVRPFDAEAVRRSAERAGAPEEGRSPSEADRAFVTTSRRLGLAFERDAGRPTDPGAALMELIGFAEEVARSQPARAREPLFFPVLARLDRG